MAAGRPLGQPLAGLFLRVGSWVRPLIGGLGLVPTTGTSSVTTTRTCIDGFLSTPLPCCGGVLCVMWHVVGVRVLYGYFFSPSKPCAKAQGMPKMARRGPRTRSTMNGENALKRHVHVHWTKNVAKRLKNRQKRHIGLRIMCYNSQEAKILPSDHRERNESRTLEMLGK